MEIKFTNERNIKTWEVTDNGTVYIVEKTGYEIRLHGNAHSWDCTCDEFIQQLLSTEETPRCRHIKAVWGTGQQKQIAVYNIHTDSEK